MSEILDLPVQCTTRAPVFVIGAARSGTSLLCSLMRRYLKISFGTESQFVVRIYENLPRYDDLRSDANLQRLVDDIARERCFRRWTHRFGFVLDKQRVFDRAAAGPRNYGSVLKAFFEQLATFHGMERWGDKTPEYNQDLPILLSIFPDAQFVHIVRDGRDVALSTLKMYFGAGNAYRAAVDWRETILRIGQFCSSLPATQVHSLQYEALLSEPVATLERLIGFLGIPNGHDVLPAIAADVPSQLREGNSAKWRTEMLVQEQRLYEAIAGRQLRAEGYATPHHEERRLRPVEHMYWQADHLVRKTLKKRYWSDTVYRAGVKMRTATTFVRH